MTDGNSLNPWERETTRTLFGCSSARLYADKIQGRRAGNEGIIQEECHKCKCSFLEDENIEYHNAYIGNMIKEVCSDRKTMR